MCYHDEFGRSALKGVAAEIQNSLQNWRAFELRFVRTRGVADPKICKYEPLPTCVTTSNLVVLSVCV